MVRTGTCPLCEASCGILVDTDGERIRSIRGDRDDPFSLGYICPKAAALSDLHDDPDRVRAPLIRDGSRWRCLGSRRSTATGSISGLAARGSCGPILSASPGSLG